MNQAAEFPEGINPRDRELMEGMLEQNAKLLSGAGKAAFIRHGEIRPPFGLSDAEIAEVVQLRVSKPMTKAARERFYRRLAIALGASIAIRRAARRWHGRKGSLRVRLHPLRDLFVVDRSSALRAGRVLLLKLRKIVYQAIAAAWTLNGERAPAAEAFELRKEFRSAAAFHRWRVILLGRRLAGKAGGAA